MRGGGSAGALASRPPPGRPPKPGQRRPMSASHAQNKPAEERVSPGKRAGSAGRVTLSSEMRRGAAGDQRGEGRDPDADEVEDDDELIEHIEDDDEEEEEFLDEDLDAAVGIIIDDADDSDGISDADFADLRPLSRESAGPPRPESALRSRQTEPDSAEYRATMHLHVQGGGWGGCLVSGRPPNRPWSASAAESVSKSREMNSVHRPRKPHSAGRHPAASSGHGAALSPLKEGEGALPASPTSPQRQPSLSPPGSQEPFEQKRASLHKSVRMSPLFQRTKLAFPPKSLCGRFLLSNRPLFDNSPYLEHCTAPSSRASSAQSQRKSQGKSLFEASKGSGKDLPRGAMDHAKHTREDGPSPASVLAEISSQRAKALRRWRKEASKEVAAIRGAESQAAEANEAAEKKLQCARIDEELCSAALSRALATDAARREAACRKQLHKLRAGSLLAVVVLRCRRDVSDEDSNESLARQSVSVRVGQQEEVTGEVQASLDGVHVEAVWKDMLYLSDVRDGETLKVTWLGSGKGRGGGACQGELPIQDINLNGDGESFIKIPLLEEGIHTGSAYLRLAANTSHIEPIERKRVPEGEDVVRAREHLMIAQDRVAEAAAVLKQVRKQSSLAVSTAVRRREQGQNLRRLELRDMDVVEGLATERARNLSTEKDANKQKLEGADLRASGEAYSRAQVFLTHAGAYTGGRDKLHVEKRIHAPGGAEEPRSRVFMPFSFNRPGSAKATPVPLRPQSASARPDFVVPRPEHGKKQMHTLRVCCGRNENVFLSKDDMPPVDRDPFDLRFSVSGSRAQGPARPPPTHRGEREKHSAAVRTMASQRRRELEARLKAREIEKMQKNRDPSAEKPWRWKGQPVSPRRLSPRRL